MGISSIQEPLAKAKANKILPNMDMVLQKSLKYFFPDCRQNITLNC